MFTFIAHYWAYGLLTLVATAALHYLVLALRNYVRPSLHVAQRWHWHAGAGLLGWVLAGTIAVLTLSYHAGALRDPRHIRPQTSWLQAAGGAPSTLDDASYFPPVLNQGNTNACGAFAVTEALYAEYRMRGETPPDWFSPWYTYYWTGANGGYTVMSQDANSVINNGLAYNHSEPNDGADTYSSYEIPGSQHASWNTIYSNYSGAEALSAIKGALNLGYPVVILVNVNDGMWYLTGDTTDNAGATHEQHFLVVQGYSGSRLHVRNSWGTGYGAGGTFWLTSTASILSAYVIAPGPTEVWPTVQHAPVPTATARPTSTPRPTPRPRPSSTATARPRPTATPRPKHTKTGRVRHPQPHRAAHHMRVTREMAVRSKPLLGAVKLFNAMPRWTMVIDPRRQTTHWVYACTLRHRCGWILKDHLA